MLENLIQIPNKFLLQNIKTTSMQYFIFTFEVQHLNFDKIVYLFKQTSC